MLAIERFGSIMEALSNNDSVSVSDLSIALDVSEETIRRDLDKIIRSDPTVVRVHGGAYKIKAFDKEAPYNLREAMLVGEKQRIAQRSFSMIDNGDTIMLDSSTTALFLARHIKQSDMQLTVITNSLSIADELSSGLGLHLILIGGSYRASSRSFVGYAATNQLNSYHADKAFVSCSGVHPEMGLTDNNEGEAQVRALMLNNSFKKYLLVDSEKLGRCKTNRISAIKGIDAVFTDAAMDPQWSTLMEENKVEVVSC